MATSKAACKFFDLLRRQCLKYKFECVELLLAQFKIEQNISLWKPDSTKMPASHCTCPICSNKIDNRLIVTRSLVPVLQNVALKDRSKAISFPTGDLHVVRCIQCGFVWNESFDPNLMVYDSSYNNDVNSSRYYVSHLEQMADEILLSIPQSEPINYVEIGCGDGEFLRLLVDRGAGRIRSAIGFDPSFSDERSLPPGATIHPVAFSTDLLPLIPEAANVICSRHTIEHIPDVQAFAQALTAPITSSTRVLFVETPNVDWILEKVAFQDFFYEHCSLFTPHSIGLLLAQYGLASKTKSVYFGQYMWTKAWLREGDASLPDVDGLLEKSYKLESQKLIQEWYNFIQTRSKLGPVALWGGASKGVTFALLMRAHAHDDRMLDCVVDLNLAKQSCFLPVTGLPIVSPEQAQLRKVTTIIVMNPNYLGEVKQLVNQMNWQAQIVTLNG